jgi:hypothetical protein
VSSVKHKARASGIMRKNIFILTFLSLFRYLIY